MDIDPRNPLDRLRTSSSLPDDHRETCSPARVSLFADPRSNRSRRIAANFASVSTNLRMSQCMAIVGGLRMFVMRPRTLRAAPIAQTVPPDQRVLVHDAVHPALTKRAQRRGAPGTDRRDRGKTTGYLRSLRSGTRARGIVNHRVESSARARSRRFRRGVPRLRLRDLRLRGRLRDRHTREERVEVNRARANVHARTHRPSP